MTPILKTISQCLFVILVMASPAFGKQSSDSKVDKTKPNWIVLQYHHVSEATPRITSVTKAEFRQHLQLLKREGFKVIPVSELVEHVRADKEITEKLAAITFDDGYDNIYENAHPILQEFNYPYSVFISPSPHEQALKSFLTIEQMKIMQSQGAEFGNHAFDHEYLLRKSENESQQAWQDRIKQNLVKTESWLEENLGKTIQVHAYPYGEYDQTVQNILSELNLAGLGQHSGPVAPTMDITKLPRFPASGRYANPETLATKLRTLAPLGWEYQPTDPVTSKNPPIATLSVPSDLLKYHQLNCYSPNGLALLETRNLGDGTTAFEISSKTPLPLGRNRYNCTLKDHQSGQYFWLSIPWIITDKQGEWSHN